MRRILVLGCPGSGKSTLARRIARRLDLPLIHLDTEYWNPGWVATPGPQWRDRVTALVARDTWVMDGNYHTTFDLRIPACDTIVHLDVPRWRCLTRIAKRGLTYHLTNGTSRPDLPTGCPEQLDWDFVEWVWDFHANIRPKVLATLRDLPASKTLISLRTITDVDRFVDALPRGS